MVKKTRQTAFFLNLLAAVVAITAMACTFDYGEMEQSERTLPDLIMENVEYVRVVSSDPIARFQAERAERYERQQLMKLENFSFEQFGFQGEEVNAFGMAGNASVNLSSGDIVMENGVRVEVEAEDIIIETEVLNWTDSERVLASGDDEEVKITQSNGTDFTGFGLSIDVRRQTYEFSGEASGIYIFEEVEEEELLTEEEQEDEE